MRDTSSSIKAKLTLPKKEDFSYLLFGLFWKQDNAFRMKMDAISSKQKSLFSLFGSRLTTTLRITSRPKNRQKTQITKRLRFVQFHAKVRSDFIRLFKTKRDAW